MCDRCLSVCTSLRCPPCLPASEVLATATCCSSSYCLTRYLSAASAKPYPPAYPSSTPPSQPYPGLSRRLPASHPSQQTQTLSKLSPIRPLDSSSAAHPSLALPRLPSSRGALPASPLLRVAHGGEPLHALCLGNHLSTTPAGPEQIARLRRVRPTMRRANRVPVA